MISNIIPHAFKNQSIFLMLCVIGLALSFYALHVEHNAEEDNEYVAACDISHRVSCSRVFLSEYGRIFSFLGIVPKQSFLDLPNAAYGVCFYVLMALLRVFVKRNVAIIDLILLLAVVSMSLSAYLSYILTFRLEDICVVCYSTYLCNLMLFASSWKIITEHSP